MGIWTQTTPAAQKEDTLPKNDQGFLSSEEHEGITMQILAYYEYPQIHRLILPFSDTIAQE